METIIIKTEDDLKKLLDEKGNLNINANLVCETKIDINITGNIYTHGGYIYTNGGYIYTHGGYIYINGGYIYTNGNNIDTHGGYIDTNGGYIYTHGGYISSKNINTKKK